MTARLCSFDPNAAPRALLYISSGFCYEKQYIYRHLYRFRGVQIAVAPPLFKIAHIPAPPWRNW